MEEGTGIGAETIYDIEERDMSTMTLEELRDEVENGCVEYIDRQDAVIALDCAISQLAEIHAALYRANQQNDDLLRERESASSRVPDDPTKEMLIAARDWSYRKYGKPIGNDAAIGCWQAMLAAATKPETEE